MPPNMVVSGLTYSHAILQYAKNSSPALSKVAVAFTGALSMVLGNFADSHLPVSLFWQETLEVK